MCHLELMYHNIAFQHFILAIQLFSPLLLISHLLNHFYYLIHKMELHQDLWALILQEILISILLDYQKSLNLWYQIQEHMLQLLYKMLFLNFGISLDQQCPIFIKSLILILHLPLFQVFCYGNLLLLLACILKIYFF